MNTQDNAKLLSAPSVIKGPQGYDSAAYSDENDDVTHYADFTKVYGRIPFKKPNVRTGHEREDLAAYINGRQEADPIGSCLGYCCWLLPVAGWCYLYNKMILVEQGEYGFSLNNGRPEILLPDRHFLNNPLNQYVGKFSIGDDKITVGPVTLVRVAQGKYGLAWNNAVPEILLPGVHVRKNAAFKFERFEPLDSDLIIHGPIKFLIVKSGQNQICYDAGKVQILPQGRYAFSNPSFRVGNTIETQQQNTRFSKHPVLLDGGIGLLVEGLLTYQVVDVERLITQLGDSDLAHAIEDVTKAEIARVFAGIHLEQISTATTEAQSTNSKQQIAVTGPEEIQHVSAEGHSRTLICQQIIQYVTPLVETWGVRIVTFQLESTKIADEQYASEYEQASLGMAKAKATLRSVDAENDILVRKATALANAVRIEAEGKKQSMIIAAKGDAEARILDAASRNEAAELMTDSYGRDFALAQQQVAFAGALKANVLTVLPDSVVGKQLSIQPTNGARR